MRFGKPLLLSSEKSPQTLLPLSATRLRSMLGDRIACTLMNSRSSTKQHPTHIASASSSMQGIDSPRAAFSVRCLILSHILVTTSQHIPLHGLQRRFTIESAEIFRGPKPRNTK